MKTIAVANQKGGVGKTTTATTLAHGLALKGKKTVIVDLDPQGQASSIMGLDRESGVFNLLVGGRRLEEVVRETRRENLGIIPGDKSTATAQIVLDAQRAPIDTLAQAFRGLGKLGYQYAVLDTSPSIGGIQEMAIWAADSVLIPAQVDYLSAESVAQMLETISMLTSRHGWKGTCLGILPTFFDTTNESQRNLAGLKEVYGNQVLEPIAKAVILREASAEGATIFEKDGRSRAALQYARLLYHTLEAL